MRTISGTVSTREEAEAARRRLEALGIDGDRIGLKEVDEGGEPGIFVTVKVAPEQVDAATAILKGHAGEPPPHAQSGSRTATRLVVSQPSERPHSDAAAPSPPPAPAGNRGTLARPERVERSGTDSPGTAAPAKDRQPGSTSLARMAAIAALLAALGFAVGAALGTLA